MWKNDCRLVLEEIQAEDIRGYHDELLDVERRQHGLGIGWMA